MKFDVKFDQKKKIILLVCVGIFIAFGYFILAKPMQVRKISSVEEEIVTDSISFLSRINLILEEKEYGLVFKLTEVDGSTCKKWNSLQVVFRAEGLAYSGEVDRVLQTSTCEEGKFQQTWISNLTQVMGPNFKKTGVFGEEPPLWVMEQLILEGPAGHVILSYEDIKIKYGKVPVLTPK